MWHEIRVLLNSNVSINEVCGLFLIPESGSHIYLHSTVMHSFAFTSNMSSSIIKSNLRGLLRSLGVLVECSVGVMLLALDRGAKFEQRFGHFLLRRLEHVHQATSKGFVVLGKECDRKAVSARSASSIMR